MGINYSWLIQCEYLRNAPERADSSGVHENIANIQFTPHDLSLSRVMSARLGDIDHKITNAFLVDDQNSAALNVFRRYTAIQVGCFFAKRCRGPARRYQAQLRFLDAVRKQGRRGFVHSRRRDALLLGVNRIEIDEPRLEQCLRDGFECGVGIAQEGDAVVKRPKYSRNFILLRSPRYLERHRVDEISIQRGLGAAGIERSKVECLQ